MNPTTNLKENNATTQHVTFVPETAIFNGKQLNFEEIIKAMNDQMKSTNARSAKVFESLLKNRDIRKTK